MPVVKSRRPTASADEPTDGRARRSARSQKAIVDAVVALVAEAPTELTIEAVAARAGVSVRTLFRHFVDTDALFDALHEHFSAEASKIALAWSPTSSLDGDLDALVAARARMFVFVEPLRQLGRTARLPPPNARVRFAKSRRRARADLRQLLAAHVSAVPADELDALDAWVSIDVWDRLHDQQGLSHARALRVMQRTARTLGHALARANRSDSERPRSGQ